MKRLFQILFFITVFFLLILSSWYVLHGDIEFPSDIARDFHLLQELDQKKIVLIGPRSSTGLFHGPLWLYLNYPAYLVGDGNPVIVGWYWIVLTIVFLISSFFIAKKLFNDTTAYFFVLMLAVYMSFHTRGMFNPHGAMLLLPAFLFFFIQYVETSRLKYLLIHLFLTGLIIQFQMAIGLPFLILSFLYLVYFTFQKRTKLHLFSFFLIIIPLINFPVFDIRNDFLLSKLTLRFLSSSGEIAIVDLLSILYDRIKLMLSGVELLRRDPGYRNLGLFITLLGFILLQIKDKKYRRIYLSFLYFYVGFFFVSLLNNKGPILYFYFFPLFPLVFLIFSSFVTSRYKKAFTVLFFTILTVNIFTAIDDVKQSAEIIGKSEYSWKFLQTTAKKIFQGRDKEFGYFVYAPDSFAYEPKYAMLYMAKSYPEKKAFYFQKKPVTYLFVAPPPPDNPHMKDDFWRMEQVKMDGKPTRTEKFGNGYKIERYELTQEEIVVPFDPSIDPGIHFR